MWNEPSKLFAEIYIHTLWFESRTRMQNEDILFTGNRSQSDIKQKFIVDSGHSHKIFQNFCQKLESKI
jgi:hypothetical protein